MEPVAVRPARVWLALLLAFVSGLCFGWGTFPCGACG